MAKLAKEKTQRSGRPTNNSRWLSAELAQAAVDQLAAKHAPQIEKWVREANKTGPRKLTLEGTYGTRALGDYVDHLGNY